MAIAEFQYNDKEHVAIGHTLFYVNYGRHPWKGNLTVEIEIPSLEKLLKKIEVTREKARTAMERTKDMMKRQYDKRTCQSKGLKIGEQVWLEAKNIQTNQLLKKLDQKKYGPFTIKEEIRQEAYRLELLSSRDSWGQTTGKMTLPPHTVLSRRCYTVKTLNLTVEYAFQLEAYI